MARSLDWMGWLGCACVLGCAACGPSHGDAFEAEDAGGSEGDAPMSDPRVALVGASYGFDSGCTPYQSSSITVEVHAVDAPIETVELRSYSIAGYMSGEDVWLGEWGGSDALPLARGDSTELRFYDEEDGWAGECADFMPATYESTFEGVVVIDGEEIDLAGPAGIGCGWSEC
ncbi:MAG TPA: hypothetical protein VFG69_09515 [Nannocystaceae bacterium]|nr:hypothetical protein [Nannocystaceae bacterium]